ncbi:MAG: efflux RND transporter periplasmic adaptor subunit [Armatimonadetes bacterium]|nr:efflux RND transporter periplasmic adaptor subunit [Armatimonadota bacterium]
MATRPVAAATVSQEVVSAPVEVTGTVRATVKADVSAKIMSRVARVLVREGDRVQAGQVLVRLESADLDAAVAQARAAVRSAAEAVKQAHTGAGIQAVQSSTRVAQSEAALDVARQQLSLVTEGPRRQQKVQADAGVAEAEAALAQARANLSLVREGSRRQQRLQAQQAILQAEAQYRTAKATHDRFKTLLDQEVVSRQRYDEVNAQYETAAAQLEMARQQASLVEEGARPQEVQAAEESVRQAEARLAGAKQQRDLAHEGGREQDIAAARAQAQQAEEALRLARAATAETRIKRDNIALLAARKEQAEAALQAAEVQAAYAVVRSPFSGVVTARQVDPGDMAAPGSPLVRIEGAAGYRLEATVPEGRMSRVQSGMAVPAAIESLGWKGTGRAVEIVPSAEPGSRTFVVKVALPPLPRIASGVFGKAWFPGEERSRLVVPAAAVVRRGQLESVLAIDEKGIARVRMVRTGETENGKVEILSGVQPGERVVVGSPADIPDGTPVEARGSEFRVPSSTFNVER